MWECIINNRTYLSYIINLYRRTTIAPPLQIPEPLTCLKIETKHERIFAYPLSHRLFIVLMMWCISSILVSNGKCQVPEFCSVWSQEVETGFVELFPGDTFNLSTF